MSNPAKTIEAEAKRGAQQAYRLLADNPTQEDIQTVWQWSIDDQDIAETALSDSFHKAYRRVLRPHLI